MQFFIHLNYRDEVNATGATSINNSNAFNAFLTNFVQIKMKLNMKMSKIKELYELKKKNLSKIIL